MTSPTLDALNAQIDATKTKLEIQIRELVDLIANDLPNYTLKHVRRAFLEDIEFGEGKSDKELAEFKEKVELFGKNLAQETRTALLENMDQWWDPSIDVNTAAKTLDANPFIHKKLQRIATQILDFLSQEKLAKIDLEYHTPSRFIDGKYPPGMIEKYWAALANLRSLEEERNIVGVEARKVRLAQRWDAL